MAYLVTDAYFGRAIESGAVVIVETEDKPVADRDKMSGGKGVLRCTDWIYQSPGMIEAPSTSSRGVLGRSETTF